MKKFNVDAATHGDPVCTGNSEHVRYISGPDIAKRVLIERNYETYFVPVATLYMVSERDTITYD